MIEVAHPLNHAVDIVNCFDSTSSSDSRGLPVHPSPFTLRPSSRARLVPEIGDDELIGCGFVLGCVASFISEDATVIESCVAWGGAYVVSLLIAAIVGLGRQ